MNIKFSVISFYIALFLALPSILGSCDTPRQTAAVPLPVNSDKKARIPSEVVTVILKAYTNSADSLPVFEISEIVKREGYLKSSRVRKEKGYYKATIADIGGAIIDSSFFENPLQQRLEYSEDDGKMASEIVRRQVGYTSVRVNYVKGIKTLNIFDEMGKMVASFDLNKDPK